MQTCSHHTSMYKSDHVPDKTHWIIISYSHEVISYIHIALRQYLCGTFMSRHDLQTILKTTPRKQAMSTVTMTTCTELLYNSEGNPVKKNRALFLVSFSQVCWVTALFYKRKMTALACVVDCVDFLNMLIYLILLNVMFCLYFLNAICSKQMHFKKEIKYICTTLADYYKRILWYSHIVWLILFVVYGDHLITADRHAEVYCRRM